jgi:hypothetical protein
VIRNLRVWDAHCGFHTGCPRVYIEGAEFYDCLYGMWRCVLDGHEHNGVRYTEVKTPLFFPRHGKVGGKSDDTPYPEDRPVDDLAPTTVVTSVERSGGGLVRVRGTTTDNGLVKRVVVNGREARAVRPNHAEWEVELAAGAGELQLTAHAEDTAGNVEKFPHKVRVE